MTGLKVTAVHFELLCEVQVFGIVRSPSAIFDLQFASAINQKH